MSEDQKMKTDLNFGPGFFGPTMSDKKIGDDPFLRAFVTEALTTKEKEEHAAKHKIEVAFSWDRTERGPALAHITIWESGKKLHGGGDDKMFWCGYPDCGKPVPSSSMHIDVGVCLSCRRALFRNPDDKAGNLREAAVNGLSTSQMVHYACISESKFAKLSVPRLAALLEKIWRDLECNADVCVRFFKKKMRFEPGDRHGVDIVARARMNRSYVVYKLEAILKDTAGGSSVRDRFEAFLSA